MSRVFLLILFSSSCYCSDHLINFKLSFIKDINIKSGIKFKKTILGGLSAIRYDKKEKLLYAVSDDRSLQSPARFYIFDIILTKTSFKINPKKVVFLKNKKGKLYFPHTIDPEGLVILKNKNILISSEGNIRAIPMILPSIIEFSKDGKYLRELVLPKKLKIGTLNNASLESLSLRPDYKELFTMTESPLLNDITKKGPLPLRLYSFTQDQSSDYIKNKEYLYPIDQKSLNPKKFNGVSEILALDKNNLLILERSYIKKTNKNILKIFLATIEESTTDISNIKSLSKTKNQIKPLRKKLLFDLEQFSKDFQFGYQYLDNIEGVCFGPTLKNGNKTLLFISDNNFSKKQRTQILSFEIIKN